MAHYVIVGHPVREKMTIEVKEYPGKKFNISIDKRKNEGKMKIHMFLQRIFCTHFAMLTKQ